VIPPGIDPFFLKRGSSPTKQPYFLHPATGDRRENTDLVLRAYAEATPPATLALVGTPLHQCQELLARSLDLGIDRKAIRIHGWVTDQELRDLYRGAIALVHPARYEGFAGLQPLEAMAQGTPVIALAAPGVTEALGGIAVLVSEDPTTLGEAMRRLASDPTEREALAERGTVFAHEHTWERAARAFVGILDRLPSRHVP
jgi:glycosyltransferase involved in cell wall biosynthesis